MDLQTLMNRVQALILKPHKEWIIIRDEDHSIRDLFIDFAGPLITLGSITIFVRNLFLEYSLLGNVIYALIYFLSMLGSMYISSLIIHVFSANFGLQKSRNRIATLVVYSSTAFYLTQAVVNMHNQLALLVVFSLYSVYLFWLGAEIVLKIEDKRKMGFVILSMLIIYLSFLLFQYLLSPVLMIFNDPTIFS